jgi:hypothetical protein
MSGPEAQGCGGGRAFSLVEVSVSATILGATAILLGAIMSTSNALQFASYRLGIARSIAVRQMELIEGNIVQSRNDSGGPALAVEAGLKLATLRSNGQVYALTQSGGSQTEFAGPAGTLAEQSGKYEVQPTSNFYLLNTTNMAQQELDQLSSQGMRLRLYAAALRMQGFTASGQELPPSGAFPDANWQSGTAGDLQSLDLIMFQVVVSHKENPSAPGDGDVVLSLERMFRVWSQTTFAAGQF